MSLSEERIQSRRNRSDGSRSEASCQWFCCWRSVWPERSATFQKARKDGADRPPRPTPRPRAAAGQCRGFPRHLERQRRQIEPSITAEFDRVHDVIVTSPTDGGLGPRFNSNSCASCHAYPAVGGSSPPSNPLFSIYQLQRRANTMPSFNTSTGPILEARFINQPGTTIPDGTVHQFSPSRAAPTPPDAIIAQPDFVTAAVAGQSGSSPGDSRPTATA